MRTTVSMPLLALVSLLASPSLWAADVFKCTSADGKISYSARPCTAEGAKEVVVPIVPPPANTGPTRDWAAINAAANARAKAAAASAAAPASAAKASAPAKSPQEIVAECEANHGVDCNSLKEIAQREADGRTLTPEEASAMQRAAAGRRENERKEAEAKAAEAKKKADAAAAAAAAAAKPPATPATPASPAPQPGGATKPGK